MSFPFSIAALERSIYVWEVEVQRLENSKDLQGTESRDFYRKTLLDSNLKAIESAKLEIEQLKLS